VIAAIHAVFRHCDWRNSFKQFFDEKKSGCKAIAPQFIQKEKAVKLAKQKGINRPVQHLCSESFRQRIEIEYYDDEQSTGKFFVCLNRYHIFEANREDDLPEWKMLVPESEPWSAVHQRIYRNFRAKKVNREDLPLHLPPPPDSLSPDILNPLPVSPTKSIAASAYPSLAKHLAKIEGNSLMAFLILSEDLYESQLGDGVFHYPEQIFFDESSETEFRNADHDEYTRYHVRQGAINLCDGILDVQIQPMMFDHFSVEKVLSMANAKIEQG
jgi:hypothetical protein